MVDELAIYKLRELNSDDVTKLYGGAASLRGRCCRSLQGRQMLFKFFAKLTEFGAGSQRSSFNLV